MIALRRLICRLIGHRWVFAQGRPDSALAAIWRPITMCWRCGQLDVGQPR